MIPVDRRMAAFVAVGVLTIGALASLAFGLPFGLPADEPRVREVGAEAGLYYDTARSQAFGNGGAGVYVADVDNDGWQDVLAIGGPEPTLFENTGGQFERSDALPALETDVKGALFFDHDNDGWQDLLLLPVRGEPVFLENDAGRFHQRDVGLDTGMHIAIGASAADYDRDGCLDLFIIQSGDWREGIPEAAKPAGPREASGDNGNPNLLFEGNCESFERVTDAGIEGTRWSLATSFADFTGDGYPDIHVGNDFNSDVLYVNQRNGTFVRSEIPGTNRHAMASETADVTGDRRLDIFVSNIHFDREVWGQQRVSNADNRGNNLLVNRGNGTFTSEERAYGVRDGGWGWAAEFVDLDNDGDRDLVHTTKHYLLDTNGDGAQESVETPPRVWERTGANFTRLNATAVGFETSSGRGLARLDYDRDGDQDLVVANNVGLFKLYETRTSGANWLQVTLAGNGTGTVLGSDVYVKTDAGTRYRRYTARADFLSQTTRTLHVGLADDESVSVRIVWPDGTERVLEDVAANQRLRVTRGGGVERVDTSA